MTEPLHRRPILLAGLAAVVAAPAVLGRLTAALSRPPLEYEPLADLPPFRRLGLGGATSSPDAALVGIADPTAGDRDGAGEAAVRAAPCEALFGGWPEGRVLPIAYFSSFQCPYCRVLEPELASLVERSGGRIHLVHHERPVFGPASELAARASVAAGLQGRQDATRARLLRSGLVTDEAYIRAALAPLGLDADRLLRDMRSAAVARAIERSRTLARLFGFAGTPALVVGRTGIEGRVASPLLERVVEAERDLPPPCAPARSARGGA